jgi:probable biosynthetic protein (TIGR04098 family)
VAVTALAQVLAAPVLPETPRRLRIGMPHLDAGGLSENWLLRHAGDLHWEAIGRRLAAASHHIESDAGDRLYPTFVAVRARYGGPLSAVRENDLFEASVAVLPCGRACAHGRMSATAGATRLDLELLTTFAVCEGSGLLRMAVPAARLATRWMPTGPLPAIARLARDARRGEPLADSFSGPALDAGTPLGRLDYEPSPYADYNGAGLLYFPSYVTIADTVERRLVRALGLAPDPTADWALAASPVRRDVFYYCNLPLGETLTAELLAFERTEDRDGVRTRMRLRRARGGETMADVVTLRELVRR